MSIGGIYDSLSICHCVKDTANTKCRNSNDVLLFIEWVSTLEGLDIVANLGMKKDSWLLLTERGGENEYGEQGMDCY